MGNRRIVFTVYVINTLVPSRNLPRFISDHIMISICPVVGNHVLFLRWGLPAGPCSSNLATTPCYLATTCYYMIANKSNAVYYSRSVI